MKIKLIILVGASTAMAGCNGKKKKLQQQQERYHSSIDSIDRRSKVIEDSTGIYDNLEENLKDHYNSEVSLLESERKSIQEIYAMKRKGLDTVLYIAKKKAALAQENLAIAKKALDYKIKIDSLEQEKKK